MEELALYLTPMLLELAEKHPVSLAIMAGMGSLRAIFKPLMGLLEKYVKSTPSKKDDEKLGAVLNHKAFKAFAWLLDYVASVKLPKK